MENTFPIELWYLIIKYSDNKSLVELSKCCKFLNYYSINELRKRLGFIELCTYGDIIGIEYLISINKNNNTLELTNIFNECKKIAIFQDNLQMLKFLCSKHILNSENYFQESILAYACKYSRLDAVQYLIEERNMDINGMLYLDLTERPKSCIELALMNNDFAIVRYLLEHITVLTYIIFPPYIDKKIKEYVLNRSREIMIF